MAEAESSPSSKKGDQLMDNENLELSASFEDAVPNPNKQNSSEAAGSSEAIKKADNSPNDSIQAAEPIKAEAIKTPEQICTDRLNKFMNFSEELWKRDKEREEARWGKGRMAELNKWAETSAIGKVVKTAVKILIGAGIGVGASLIYGPVALLVVPLLTSLGTREAIDGALEAMQYFLGKNSEKETRLAMETAKFNLRGKLNLFDQSTSAYEKMIRGHADPEQIKQQGEDLASFTGELKELDKAALTAMNADIKKTGENTQFRLICSTIATIAVGALHGVPLGHQNFGGSGGLDSHGHNVFWSVRNGFEFIYHSAAERASSLAHGVLKHPNAASHIMGKTFNVISRAGAASGGMAIGLAGMFARVGIELKRQGKTIEQGELQIPDFGSDEPAKDSQVIIGSPGQSGTGPEINDPKLSGDGIDASLGDLSEKNDILLPKDASATLDMADIPSAQDLDDGTAPLPVDAPPADLLEEDSTILSNDVETTLNTSFPDESGKEEDVPPFSDSDALSEGQPEEDNIQPPEGGDDIFDVPSQYADANRERESTVANVMDFDEYFRRSEIDNPSIKADKRAQLLTAIIWDYGMGKFSLPKELSIESLGNSMGIEGVEVMRRLCALDVAYYITPQESILFIDESVMPNITHQDDMVRGDEGKYAGGAQFASRLNGLRMAIANFRNYLESPDLAQNVTPTREDEEGDGGDGGLHQGPAENEHVTTEMLGFDEYFSTHPIISNLDRIASRRQSWFIIDDFSRNRFALPKDFYLENISDPINPKEAEVMRQLCALPADYDKSPSANFTYIIDVRSNINALKDQAKRDRADSHISFDDYSDIVSRLEFLRIAVSFFDNYLISLPEKSDGQSESTDGQEAHGLDDRSDDDFKKDDSTDIETGLGNSQTTPETATESYDAILTDEVKEKIDSGSLSSADLMELQGRLIRSLLSQSPDAVRINFGITSNFMDVVEGGKDNAAKIAIFANLPIRRLMGLPKENISTKDLRASYGRMDELEIALGFNRKANPVFREIRSCATAFGRYLSPLLPPNGSRTELSEQNEEQRQEVPQPNNLSEEKLDEPKEPKPDFEIPTMEEALSNNFASRYLQLLEDTTRYMEWIENEDQPSEADIEHLRRAFLTITLVDRSFTSSTKMPELVDESLVAKKLAYSVVEFVNSGKADQLNLRGEAWYAAETPLSWDWAQVDPNDSVLHDLYGDARGKDFAGERLTRRNEYKEEKELFNHLHDTIFYKWLDDILSMKKRWFKNKNKIASTERGFEQFAVDALRDFDTVYSKSIYAALDNRVDDISQQARKRFEDATGLKQGQYVAKKNVNGVYSLNVHWDDIK